MKRTSEAVGPRNDGALTGNAGFQCGLGDTTAKPSPKWSPLGRRTFVKYRLPCLSSYKRDRKTKACDEMAWTPCTTSNIVEVSLASTEGAGWYVWVGKKYWRHFWGFLYLFFCVSYVSPFFGTSQNSYQVVTLSLLERPPNLWGERWYDALMGFVAFVYQGAKGRKDVKDVMDRGVFFWNTNFCLFFLRMILEQTWI